VNLTRDSEWQFPKALPEALPVWLLLPTGTQQQSFPKLCMQPRPCLTTCSPLLSRALMAHISDISLSPLNPTLRSVNK
jgi:hypothetical protein